MDDKDWIILKTISEEKTISKAADRLYLSQPALSNRLKNMEREVGASIVLRTSNGVVFTPEGDHLLAYALDSLRRQTFVKERIQNMGGAVYGTLQLGTSAVFAHCELPAILQGFTALYPAVEISVKTGLSSKVTKMLQKEEISVAVIRGDHFWPEKKHMLKSEHLCLASFSPIAFDDLPQRPRIHYGTDPSLRNMLHDWWHETFACPPRISMEVDSMDTCRQMVLHNLGWAILPEAGLKEPHNLHTQNLYWRDQTPVLRPTWLLYRNWSAELPAVNAFIRYLQDYYAP
ncbi:LysR family transcriptional regulator [Azotosporobacter soli]|uniref:LysR family transcriptional regulator n=1 Tax=Azotosporobacter soli TaxID=3055040 RepID=UPI0031FF025D